MSALSKFIGGTLGFRLMTASCHEFGHTWNPNCYLALTDALGDALFFCFKTYGLLYLVNSAVHSGGNPRKITWGRILKNTVRSSIFLTTNLILLIFFICRMRQMLGFAIWPTVSFVSSFASSLVAIFIEAKKRRLMLALYLSNLASESVFRQLLHRGHVREVPGAQAIIFSIGLAVIFQLLSINSRREDRKNNAQAGEMYMELNAHDPVLRNSRAVSKDVDDKFLRSIISLTHFDARMPTHRRRVAAVKLLRAVLSLLSTTVRRRLMSDAVFERLTSDDYLSQRVVDLIDGIQHSARNFAVAAIVSILLAFFRNANKPMKFLSTLRRPTSLLRMPLFVGLMPLLYQLANYVLQSLLGDVLRPISSAICGATSGLAMLVWPNTNISMYVLWKAIELLYRKLASISSLLPIWEYGDVLLYSIASGYVVGMAVIEPHTLRGNYYKFLTRLTGNRIHLFNRELLSRYFGFDSNRLYAGSVPVINSGFTTINPQLYRAAHTLKPVGI